MGFAPSTAPSFGLGRQSVGEGITMSAEESEKVQLVASSTLLVPKVLATSTSIGMLNGASAIVAPMLKPAITGPYVGSKSGTKYYLTSCSGVKRIKEANKVFFASVNDAVAAGYQPAVNCPGL